MTSSMRRVREICVLIAAICAGAASASCAANGADDAQNGVGAAATGGAGDGAGASGGMAGTSAPTGTGGAGSGATNAGASSGGMEAGTTGGAGSSGGSSGDASIDAGEGGTEAGGDGGAGTSALAPLMRADGFASLAPPLGEPLPASPPGEWLKVPVEGTVCRDGSAMSIFVRRSATSSSYFMFLEGGGVCFDDFFCPLNPDDIDHSLDGETVLGAGFGNLGGAAPIPQAPRPDGIFKNDPRNPVADWNAIYVPYCSGDVYGGTRTGATVPRWPAGGAQTFAGYDNMQLVIGRVVATFMDAEKALLTGSSAGGVGSLMNASTFVDALIDYTDTRGFIVSDSGPVFDDPYLEVCLQKEWRDLWGLNDAFPPDCDGCRNPDGSGIARGVGEYLFQKYPGDQVVGGLISTVQDEIMQLFFGKGLGECAGNPFYPIDRYPAGLKNFRDEITDKTRFGTYFLPGTLHMHIFRPRFYETSGNSITIADWLTKLLNNEVVHVTPAGGP